MMNLRNFDSSTQKSQKYVLYALHKYIILGLNKHRVVMFDGTAY